MDGIQRSSAIEHLPPKLTRRGLLKIFAGAAASLAASSVWDYLSWATDPITAAAETLPIPDIPQPLPVESLQMEEILSWSEIQARFAQVSVENLSAKVDEMFVYCDYLDQVYRSILANLPDLIQQLRTQNSLQASNQIDKLTLMLRRIADYSHLVINQDFKALPDDQNRGTKLQNTLKLRGFQIISSLESLLPEDVKAFGGLGRAVSSHEKFDFWGEMIAGYDENSSISLWSRESRIATDESRQWVANRMREVDMEALELFDFGDTDKVHPFELTDKDGIKWVFYDSATDLLQTNLLTEAEKTEFTTNGEIKNPKIKIVRYQLAPDSTEQQEQNIEVISKIREIRVNNWVDKLHQKWGLFMQMEKRYNIPAPVVAALIGGELLDIDTINDGQYVKKFRLQLGELIGETSDLSGLAPTLRSLFPDFEKDYLVMLDQVEPSTSNIDNVVKRFFLKSLGILSADHKPLLNETDLERLLMILDRSASGSISQITTTRARQGVLQIWNRVANSKTPGWLIAAMLEDEDRAIESAFNYLRSFFNTVAKFRQSGELLQFYFAEDLLGPYFSQYQLTPNSESRGSFPNVEGYRPMIFHPLFWIAGQYSGGTIVDFLNLSGERKFDPSFGYTSFQWDASIVLFHDLICARAEEIHPDVVAYREKLIHELQTREYV